MTNVLIIKKIRIQRVAGKEERQCEETQGEDIHLQAMEKGLGQVFPHSPQREPTPCEHLDFGF